MKKRNSAIQAAVVTALLAIGGTANAGTIATTFKTYASELWGTNSSGVTIQLSPITYQLGTPVAAGQAIKLYVALSGGAKWNASLWSANLTGLDAANAAMTVVSLTLSTDSTYAIFTVQSTANGFNTNSTITLAPAAASAQGFDGVLGTPGGTVSTTVTLDSGASNVTSVPTGGTNIDAGGTPGSVAQSAAAITGKFVASSAFPFLSGTPAAATGTKETQQIDVGASPTTALFTTGVNSTSKSIVNLGALMFTDTTGTQDNGAGADYTLAANTATAGSKVVVSGDFSLAEAQGGKKGVYLTSTIDCSTTEVAAPGGAAVVINAGKNTATFTGVTSFATNVAYYVCMSIKATNTTAITPSAYTAVANLGKPTATDQNNAVASSPLLSTTINGKVVTVRSYIPAAVTGYIQTIRIINTGTVAATPSLTLIDEATGTAGTSVPVATSIPAGGVLRLSQSQVEALVGTQAATARPRIRVSASTDGLEVQSLFNNASGAYTNLSGNE